MTITGQSSLDPDVIKQMVADAEEHAEEDRRRREAADVRNTADSLVYQTEKLLSDQADAASEDEKKAINSKLDDLRTALEGDDTDAIKSATEALMTASQQFGQRLYEAAAAADRQSGASASGSSSSAGSDDDVMEAEIVDDDKGGS